MNSKLKAALSNTLLNMTDDYAGDLDATKQGWLATNIHHSDNLQANIPVYYRLMLFFEIYLFYFKYNRLLKLTIWRESTRQARIIS